MLQNNFKVLFKDRSYLLLTLEKLQENFPDDTFEQLLERFDLKPEDIC